MSDNTEDTGIIEALLQRLNDFRLPRLLELQGRVDAGETLTGSDMDFLEQSLADANDSRSLIDRHPEVQPLAVKLTALYHDIIAKGLENEKKAEGR
jgi:hypothetical protein